MQNTDALDELQPRAISFVILRGVNIPAVSRFKRVFKVYLLSTVQAKKSNFSKVRDI